MKVINIFYINNIFIFSDFVFISKVCTQLYDTRSNICNNIFFYYNKSYFHLEEYIKFIEYDLILNQEKYAQPLIS